MFLCGKGDGGDPRRRGGWSLKLLRSVICIHPGVASTGAKVYRSSGRSGRSGVGCSAAAGFCCHGTGSVASLTNVNVRKWTNQNWKPIGKVDCGKRKDDESHHTRELLPL